MNPKVDFYFLKEKKWQDEILLLRELVLSCKLTEELKWGVPCYTMGDSNIVLIHVFKEYCAILFFKGVLLKDPKGVLIQQTKNVQSARHFRFTNVDEIRKHSATIKSYIKEAIEIEKAGLKVEFKKTEEFAVPKEFQDKLDTFPKLKKSFDALTPGRQRAYLFYFNQPKQIKTREARVEKSIHQILNGKGLND